MRLLSIFFLFSTLFFCTKTYGQEVEGSAYCAEETTERIKKNRSVGIMPTLDLSYVGYSTSLLLEYERKSHGFYVGPQYLASSSYMPQKGPFGLVGGYKFYFINSLKKWKVYLNIDYKNYIFKAYKGIDQVGSKRNFIHEVNIGYGMQYMLSSKFFLGNSIHFGKYFESYYNYRLQERNGINGYNGLIRIFFKYRIV